MASITKSALTRPIAWTAAASPRSLFLLWAHLFFGIWLLCLGLSKLIGGPVGTVAWMRSEFAETWVPAALVTVLGWIIIVMENVVGVWLLAGVRARWAWIAAGKLLFLLIMGKTILGEYGTVADNWLYLILILACAALSGPDDAER